MMLHIKYQGSILCAVVSEKIYVFTVRVNVKHVTPGWDRF